MKVDKDFIHEEEIMIRGKTYKQITYVDGSKVLKRLDTKINMWVRMCNVHTMRHTFATRLFEKGAAAKTISELLGHASVSFTLDTYTHVMPNTKKQAI